MPKHGGYGALIALEIPNVGMNYVALMYALLLLGHSMPLGNPIPYGCQPCGFKVHEVGDNIMQSSSELRPCHHDAHSGKAVHRAAPSSTFLEDSVWHYPR
jgi:hypothetical protein